MTEPTQNYATHRRYHPMFHFFALPVLGINLIVQFIGAVRHPQFVLAWWNVLVAAALVATCLVARNYALANQNRLIRLEETLRLGRVLPEDLRSRIPELRMGSLIALRFSPDDELPDLTRAVLSGELTSANDIKKRIQYWRADEYRV